MKLMKIYLLAGLALFAIAPALSGCDQVTELIGIRGAPGEDGNNGAKGALGAQGLPGEYGAALLPCDGCVENPSLADQAVGTLELSSKAVRSNHIMDGAVTNSKLDNSAVTMAKFLDQAVTGAKIISGEVTATELAPGSVTAGKIAAGAVQSGNIAAGAVETCDIASNAVQAGDLAAGAVQPGDIAPGAVGSTNIVAGAVDARTIALGAVNRIWTKSGDNIDSIGLSNWTPIDDMSITFTARGGAYWVLFNGGFYSAGSNAEAQVRLVEGNTILNMQRLPSVSKPVADLACSLCVQPHSHSGSGQYLGSLTLHWTGELAAGSHTFEVEWRNGQTAAIYSQPLNRVRNLTIVEFAKTEVEEY
ncbi:MAG TPA: collagen-like protein [bacterium]|nr:collagen-like protein [bacterium]